MSKLSGCTKHVSSGLTRLCDGYDSWTRQTIYCVGFGIISVDMDLKHLHLIAITVLVQRSQYRSLMEQLFCGQNPKKLLKSTLYLSHFIPSSQIGVS